MKFKKIMLVTLVLLAILTIGAVSASEDADALAVDDTGDDEVVASPIDDTTVSDESDGALLGDSEPVLDEEYRIGMGSDNITHRDYEICEIADSSSGANCRASVYANGSLVFDKTFDGYGMVYEIYAKELNGTFNGYYNIKVIYTHTDGTKWYKEQLTYFDNIVGKSAPPKPGDFNVTFAKELDLDEDRTETAVRLYIPATVLDGRIEFDGDISGYKFIYESDAGSYMELPLYFFSSLTKPGSYDIIVNYINEDDEKLELARGTLNVTKTYSADDFIELYKANINSEDDFIFWLHELESQKPEGKLSIFYNGNQAFTKTYIGTMPAYVTGKDLVGYFEGECKFTLVYERDADGKTYSKNLIANFATPINNKALTPEEFKVTFLNKEVNVDDENKVIMTCFVPDGIADSQAAIRVKYGPGSVDFKNILLYSSDINKTKQLTFGEMYIFDPTTLNLEVAYYVGSDKILDIANSTLKVTKTYTAKDFIELYTKTLSGSTDYVCNVFDSYAGLVGDVTVFADNTQVYSKKFTNAANTAVRINGSDLSGNLKGQHDIKVVYKRSADGKEYSKTAVVTFPGDAPQPNPKSSITFSNANIAFDVGGSGSVSAVVSNGKIAKAVVLSHPEATVVVADSKITVSGLDAGSYILSVTTAPNDGYDAVTQNVTITVKKPGETVEPIATKITATDVSTTYGTSKYTTVTLTSNGKAVLGKTVTLYINGKACAKGTTNDKGQVNLAVPNTLAVSNKHSATLQFDGDANYTKATGTATVKVAKATPKLVAKAKSFKRSDKYKKYSLTLKTDKNKALYKAKVYIKVNKKTYSAVVSKKGIATFKLTKLTKKGKYSAVVAYKGNANYNAVKYTKLKIVVK